MHSVPLTIRQWEIQFHCGLDSRAKTKGLWFVCRTKWAPKPWVHPTAHSMFSVTKRPHNTVVAASVARG